MGALPRVAAVKCSTSRRVWRSSAERGHDTAAAADDDDGDDAVGEAALFAAGRRLVSFLFSNARSSSTERLKMSTSSSSSAPAPPLPTDRPPIPSSCGEKMSASVLGDPRRSSSDKPAHASDTSTDTVDWRPKKFKCVGYLIKSFGRAEKLRSLCHGAAADGPLLSTPLLFVPAASHKLLFAFVLASAAARHASSAWPIAISRACSVATTFDTFADLHVIGAANGSQNAPLAAAAATPLLAAAPAKPPHPLNRRVPLAGPVLAPSHSSTDESLSLIKRRDTSSQPSAGSTPMRRWGYAPKGGAEAEEEGPPDGRKVLGGHLASTSIGIKPAPAPASEQPDRYSAFDSCLKGWVRSLARVAASCKGNTITLLRGIWAKRRHRRSLYSAAVTNGVTHVCGEVAVQTRPTVACADPPQTSLKSISLIKLECDDAEPKRCGWESGVGCPQSVKEVKWRWGSLQWPKDPTRFAQRTLADSHRKAVPFPFT